MPLTKKGNKIEHAMEREYGKDKGKQVFYASKNKGAIKGVEKGKHERALERGHKGRTGTMKSHFSGKHYEI